MLERLEKVIEQFLIDEGYQVRQVAILGSQVDEEYFKKEFLEITPYLQIRAKKI